MGSSPEVAIVGAGLAGLAAARTLAAQGIVVEVFEATERVGGRVRTARDPDTGAPVELGPEFVHGRPEATLAVLREAGLELDPIADTHHVWRDGRLTEIENIWDRFGVVLAGARDLGRDESARAYLDRSRMSPLDASLFSLLVEGFYAAPLEDISIASVARDASGSGGDDTAQARVRGGYGQLVDWLASRLAHARVDLHLGCVVHAIDWGGDLVRLGYRRGVTHGSSTAARVIVTLPVGVLQRPAPAGVSFRPGLGGHADALSRLAMGQVVKVVLVLREPVWRGRAGPELEFVHRGDTAFPTFWMRSVGGAHEVTAWAGGPHAIALAGWSPERLVERVVDELAKSIGVPRARLAAAVRAHYVHDHDADPFARGAYSYTRVGGGSAAEVLARPLGEKLFFAGEATDAVYEGTVAGALASGVRAATQLLRRL